MPSRTGHPGTRASHTRRTKTGRTTRVRSTAIKHPQARRRRNQVGRQVQQGRKPLLWGAGIMAGWGALEAILGGRFFTATLLFGLAGGFLVGHAVWQSHKRRQASKPARPKRAPAEKHEALEKAREAHQPSNAPVSDSGPPASEKKEERPVWEGSPQLRYDAMQERMASQRRLGLPERVMSDEYEEFFDGPGQVKPRPSGQPEPAPKASNGATSGKAEPTSHAEWQTLYGRRCDCTKCRAQRRAQKKVSLR